MKKVNSYSVKSSNIITNDIPPKINQNSLIDFRRKLTSLIVRDLIDVYLRNPYYKRPVLVFGPDILYVHFDKTFYVIEHEIGKALNKWANLAQAFSLNELAPVKADEIVLNEFYTVPLYHEILRGILHEERMLKFLGNEPRKYTNRELREISKALLSGNGALFEFEMLSRVKKRDKKETLVSKSYLFVPLEKGLEFL